MTHIEFSCGVKTISKNGYSFVVKGEQRLYNGELFWDLVQNDQWENETFEIIARYCSSTHSFIDVGAWIGPTTLFGACVAKHVYSIEPDPVAISELQENMRLNKQLTEKISLFEGCLCDSTGTARIGNPREFGNSESSLLFEHADNCYTVDSITFSDLVSYYDIRRCSLIKMDVEGAEVLILPTMIDFIKQYRPSLLISLHRPHYGDHGNDILENIFVILSCLYRNIYDIYGQRVQNIGTIKKPFFDLIATDFSW
jgi:FkbM family methyltransferase